MSSAPNLTKESDPQKNEMVRELFLRALSLEDDERDALMNDLTVTTRTSLEQLIEEYHQFNRLVDVKSLAFSADGDIMEKPVEPEQEPDQVGPYQIVRKLGEGGMGSVYLARGENPVRDVALKIIPGAQVSQQFRARFQAEYSALAMMNHPNISHFYNAGTTPEGNAYFSMEYIEGVPLIEFCNQHNLDLKQRLELFIQVCDGLQHAHQKAIVHRDLTPENIMVTLQEQRPIAKVIDFGLAKGLLQPLSHLEPKTRVGSLNGTPAYMSPEQLLGKVDEVDTRSDLYSMGVILYELLAGNHPYDLEHLSKLPLDEALRTLRVEDPPLPSRRLKAELGYELDTDLDHVVAMAMAKDPSRRYESVYALRDDLRNYLSARPITARAHTALDLFSKFVRRNRIWITATAVAFVALAGGLALSLNSMVKTNRAVDRYQKTLDLLQNVLSAPNPKAGGRHLKVVEVLEQAEQRLEKEYLHDTELTRMLRTTLGQTYFGLGLYREAEQHLIIANKLCGQNFGNDHPETWRSRYFLAKVLRRLLQYEEAATMLRETWDAQKRLLGPQHEHTLQSMSGYAMVLRLQKNYAEAEEIFRECEQAQEKTLGPNHPDRLMSMAGLANALHFQNKMEEAGVLYSKVWPMQKEVLGADHPETLSTGHAYANNFYRRKEYAAAEELFRDVVSRREQALGETHSETTRSLYSLGSALYRQDRFQEAVEVFSEVLYRCRSVKGFFSQESIRAATWLASSYRRLEQLDDACALLEKIVFEYKEFDDFYYLRAVGNLASYYQVQEKHNEAILWFRIKLELLKDQPKKQIPLYYTMGRSFYLLDELELAEAAFCQSLELIRHDYPDHPNREIIEADYREIFAGEE